MKICNACKQEKTLDNFTKRKGTERYRDVCHQCRREQYKNNPTPALEHAKKYYQQHREEVLKKTRDRRSNNMPFNLWRSAKSRASKRGILFEIEIADIIVPEVCPVLGIPLNTGVGKVTENSPSLDRIIPEKGYVRDNIVVVSHKANTIKNNATIEELRKVVVFYEQLLS